MMALLITWIANSLAIFAVGSFVRGVTVNSMRDAFVAGLVLSVINAIVRPILVLLTLPLTIVTLGLFYFVITAICLSLTSHFVAGFALSGFGVTIVASVLISLVSTLIYRILTNAARP
jgi:putative membrane protein